MRALIGALALSVVLLTGCGDSPSNPAPSNPSSTLTQDVAPTSGDVATRTSGEFSAESTSTSGPATAAATTAGNATVPSTTVPGTTTSVPTATSTGPTAPAPSACTGDALSQDILGFTGGVNVFFCEADWAYASYPDAPGAPQFIAERVDGRWFHVAATTDPVCKDELLARGAPPAIAKLMPVCSQGPAPTAAPTAPGPTGPQPTEPQPTGPEPTAPVPTAPEPTAPNPTDPAPTEPAPPCVIDTAQYGPAHADLTEVTCEEASAEWSVAEANAVPSWTIPWITPSGWECYVTPYDPTSEAAGSCYGPSGTAYFTLYLP